MTAPTALVILDGFGFSKEVHGNAIYHARKPMFDYCMAHYPHTVLAASGPAVGLLPGMIGNSEVGHLTLGAGRIIKQPVVQIHELIDSGALARQKPLVSALSQLASSTGRLHLMGLLSDAGVHSHEKHLYALLDIAREHGVKEIYVHPFLDGRDVAPQSAYTYLERLDAYSKQHSTVHIGSIQGRFYAMDRDANWERTQASYTMLTQQEQPVGDASWQAVLQQCYEQRIYDEFIPPTLLYEQAIIHDNDGIIFFNFRPDRARQLTACFVCPEQVPFAIHPLKLAFFITMVVYHADCSTMALLPAASPLVHTLKEVLVTHGKTLFCIAETEKYAHVTYFFGGGHEREWPGEVWQLIPSIAVRNYIQHPAMSAEEITRAVLNSLRTRPRDFYLINYANADMVGHSGNIKATQKAIEVLDEQLKQLYKVIVQEKGGTLYITADHGNAEQMYDAKAQQPSTAHTTHDVPFIMVRSDLKDVSYSLPLKELADVAPFILEQMNIPVPLEMKR